MKTPANGIKIPTWVPEPVRNEILRRIQPTDEQKAIDEKSWAEINRLWGFSPTIPPKDEKGWRTLKRLLTHKRMKHVWSELTKHRRETQTHPYRTTNDRYYKLGDRVSSMGLYVEPDPSNASVEKVNFRGALVQFFYVAYVRAVKPVPTMTRDEVMNMYGELSDVHKLLVKTAGLLRGRFGDPKLFSIFNLWRNSPDFPKKHFSLDRPGGRIDMDDFIEALLELDRFFYDALTSFNVEPFLPARFEPQGERPVVNRRTARESTRAYVFSLAETCKDLFGSSLYGIVATTACVTLKKRITADYVRKVVNK